MALFIMEKERERFENWLLGNGLKDRSIEEYLYYYDKFGSPVKELTQGYVDSFVSRWNFNSVCKAFVKNYFKFLIRYEDEILLDLGKELGTTFINQLRKINIQSRTGRKERKLPKVLSEDEIILLEKGFKTERNKLMMLLTFYCGLRLTELISITPFDFNWETWIKNREFPGELIVRGKGSKERKVFVPRWLMERLGTWIENTAIYIDNDSSNPLFRIKGNRWGKLLSQAAKLQLKRRVNPHLLRHSYATYLIENGHPIEEVKELLGHSSIATTQIYVHINFPKLREKYNKTTYLDPFKKNHQ